MNLPSKKSPTASPIPSNGPPSSSESESPPNSPPSSSPPKIPSAAFSTKPPSSSSSSLFPKRLTGAGPFETGFGFSPVFTPEAPRL